MELQLMFSVEKLETLIATLDIDLVVIMCYIIQCLKRELDISYL